MLPVFVGWDAREIAAWQVCVRSMLDHATIALDIRPLIDPHVRAAGSFWRRWRTVDGRRIDEIDGRPFATDFAFTRFLVPELTRRCGWALFCDADFLWRADVGELFQYADPRFAVLLVKHDHRPAETGKMDGQAQDTYPRKNWSSLVLWNCGHPAHRALPRDAVNTWRGEDLHGFSWLRDRDIGGLPKAWNWLDGWSAPDLEPKAVHFTRGTPDMPGYENVPHAEEWRQVRKRMVAEAT